MHKQRNMYLKFLVSNQKLGLKRGFDHGEKNSPAKSKKSKIVGENTHTKSRKKPLKPQILPKSFPPPEHFHMHVCQINFHTQVPSWFETQVQRKVSYPEKLKEMTPNGTTEPFPIAPQS